MRIIESKQRPIYACPRRETCAKSSALCTGRHVGPNPPAKLRQWCAIGGTLDWPRMKGTENYGNPA